MDRRTVTVTMLGLVATLATAAAAQAQGRGPQRVPPGHLPPAGMCRVWYDDVPPGRQPAPTSCRDAERRAGRNARVIYGDARYDRRDDGRYDRRDDVRRDERWDPRGEPGRGRVGDDGRGRVGGGSAPCVDRDRNGYCDEVGRRDLPMMSRTSTLRREQRTAMERSWLGDERMTARYSDRDRNGIPEEILWYDRRGAMVQRWQDRDRDGRVDEVVIYRDGVARVIR